MAMRGPDRLYRRLRGSSLLGDPAEAPAGLAHAADPGPEGGTTFLSFWHGGRWYGGRCGSGGGVRRDA